jgi:hypothetical protein
VREKQEERREEGRREGCVSEEMKEGCGEERRWDERRVWEGVREGCERVREKRRWRRVWEKGAGEREKGVGSRGDEMRGGDEMRRWEKGVREGGWEREEEMKEEERRVWVERQGFEQQQYQQGKGRGSGGSARKEARIFGKSGGFSIGDRRRAGARGGRGKQNKHTLTRHSCGRFRGAGKLHWFGAIDSLWKERLVTSFEKWILVGMVNTFISIKFSLANSYWIKSYGALKKSSPQYVYR